MLQKLADAITSQLGHPKAGLLGWYVTMLFRTRNRFLVEKAVDLCDLQPHHQVLEVGFGPGTGLMYACKKIKDGPGKLYGVDHSEKMFLDTAEKMFREIKDGKVNLALSGVEKLPFNKDMFDRVYHVNCYYFWKDVIDGAAELYRVMKPNSLMVTTLNIDRLKTVKSRGILTKNVNTDPMNYMWCLEAVGFRDVSIQYLQTSRGKTYEAIFAHIHEKTPHELNSEDSAASGKTVP